ncbi:MAG: hypothetical protein HOA17_04710 [Candidatus Melainabacteria bacterium]|jgi:hypothetical protein|nr:hypothetical protein [Candidatus Melainabacteria bacterium]
MLNQGPINKAFADAGIDKFRQPIDKHVFTQPQEAGHFIDISKEPKSNDAAYKFIGFLKIFGIGLTAVLHLGSFAQHLFNWKSNERSTMDAVALNTSKVVLVSQCLHETYEALKKNRVVEALARFIEPLFIVAESRIEDLGLARGLGLGISQLVGSQEGIYNELAKQKYGIDVIDKNAKPPTMGEDLDLNITAMKKIFSENIRGGFGKDRRFLTGLTGNNIKEKLGEFVTAFKLNSILDLFDSNNGDYRGRFNKFLDSSGLRSVKELFKGNDQHDKGHSDALSGYFMMIGSVMGYLGKANKNIFYKLGGAIRNLGGTVADIALFGHPEPDFNISAMFLSINTYMDIVQRFLPAKMLNIILPWSNFSMAAYNIGVGLYLNRSSKKSNEADQIAYHDTDLLVKQAAQLAKPVPAQAQMQSAL